MNQFSRVYSPHLLPKVRSDAIMSSAKGAPCTLRIASFIPGRRCTSRETTVGCHLPVWGKGASTKVTDMAVAFGCSACHAIIDGVDREARRYLEEKFGAAMTTRMLHALTETHAILIGEEIIKIPGAEIV